MSLYLNGGFLRPPGDHFDARATNGFSNSISGSRTPQMRASAGIEGTHHRNLAPEADIAAEEDPRVALFRDLYRQSEAKLHVLFSRGQTVQEPAESTTADYINPRQKTLRLDEPPLFSESSKKITRKLDDDDDYDEYDGDDDEDGAEPADAAVSPSKVKLLQDPSGLSSPSHRPSTAVSAAADSSREAKKEIFEDIRKKLEEDKKATEEAAKKSFHTIFYTLENDKDAMLDQQRLEESERQVEAEMSGHTGAGNNSTNGTSSGYGSLSNTNLGASSLTLKNLISRIDMKRTMVQASDAELRSLMSEVRKNRSKWASEEKIGQEELYEAAEKVLSELKAMTEHSTAFLTRVNKRDAPDYYTIIKHPMDLGTMTKKLKALQYKSKQEFVDDLNLIWANCLKYNTNSEHFLRKHALYMRKETEKLVPLIPDIAIRDRAEVEAEERRLQLADLDGAEESDDEPIMSSRGRKAPGKSSSKKGSAPAKKTLSGRKGSFCGPTAQASPLIRADSDIPMEGSQNGLSTPPPGTQTPSDPAGLASGASGLHADSIEIDRLTTLHPVLSALSAPGVELEDPEYKTWKQVTKKDRALIAADRHRLFKGDKLNSDEPALLRSRDGMRRLIRNQTFAADSDRPYGVSSQEPNAAGETLAEGIEEEDKIIPDYYDSMSGVPDLPHRLVWSEDSDGNVVDTSDEFLSILPKGSFTQRSSKLSNKIDANMRQMQETRKICSKIGIVKQMQLQSQMYQNQFQKYQPEPFLEQDIPPHVMNDGGPVIAPWVCKSALQRSVAKIFYHAGFEEYQPSAIDVATDITSDFFQKIGQTLKSYMEAPNVPITESKGDTTSTPKWKRAYTEPEIALHTLSSVGTSVEILESYIKEDVERLGTKLAAVHDRLRSLFTELLRPALVDGGEDGSKAFADESEQFVGGDFAEDIGEDFFGFKELGLDKELGLTAMSVPLHLLQSRMYNAAQAQNTTSTQTVTLFAPPLPYPRISSDTVKQQIGLVQEFFNRRLQANNNEPLVEDLELPPKQRFSGARPRLPASGKIPPPSANAGLNSSPQKRPPPSADQPNAIKFGLMEPSKKKAKKNSGVAMSAAGGDGLSAVDSVKVPATNLVLKDAGGIIDAHRSPPIAEIQVDADTMAIPSGISAENALSNFNQARPKEDAVTHTNGTAGHGDA